MNEFIMTLVVFSVCSMVNVMLNTIKTIVMYKQNVLSSAFINAVTYGFYTVIVVLMAGEMPLGWKIGLTAITNFIGVVISMWIMRFFEKDKLWKIELTAKVRQIEEINALLDNARIPYNVVIDNTGRYAIYNVYCATQKQSLAVAEVVKTFKVKYFASETKTL